MRGNASVSPGRAASAAARGLPAQPEDRPESIAGLDLSKPGLLEASAGTGKTYAIEHLVLRLLMEAENLDLQNILVLTFTEKATGELKDKIRGRLAWRIAKGGLPPATLARLKFAHVNFDRASIHTIHGFCQRILRKYAFENNALFNQELVKNVREVLEQALNEEMRSTWLTEAGPGPEGLESFRGKAGALGVNPATKWAKRLIDVALGYNPLRGDRLLPEYDPARIASLQGEILAGMDAVAALFPDLQPGLESGHPFLVRFRAVKFASRATRIKAAQALALALQTAAACRAAVDPRARLAAALAFFPLLDEINLTGLKNQGFSFLMPTAAECPDLPWPQLETLLGLLDRMRQAAARIARENAALAFSDQRQVIAGLRAKAQAHLQANGLITYDSMIEDVCLALREKEE
ncbi:MAG TPA: UvrD-helicase domain-containing protein, partial [Fibrobacteria bacterium]|nr:UvrD-helicase domain-containing protein [Fibrobacteria bacterium]